MAQFIHLAAERSSRSILRSGIKVARNKRLLRGVFAHPQTENFVVNHQWMRELRRFRGLSFVGVRFRIPDTERVWIGKFDAEHIDVAASEAIGMARQHTDPLGLEVIVPRPIRAKENRINLCAAEGYGVALLSRRKGSETVWLSMLSTG
jgi:hypothetical protein